MKLWRRASGALKDKNSMLIASLSSRNAPWNPRFEVTIIKATSHDESKVDYENIKRVFAWLHASPAYLKPLLSSLSTRLQKTCSWVVALKGLVLMHGVLRCNIPAVQNIGRLPFDLSNFRDSYRKSGRTWGLNTFVQSYFAFLDQTSAFLYMERKEESKETESALVQELVKLQQWQSLLGILLQIRPQAKEMDIALVYEAMNCVIIEIFSFYNRICNRVARVLTGIYAAEKVEAAMALEILQKASQQREQLALYLNFCRKIGVFNESKFPEVEQIPKKDIQKLERIVSGVSENQATVVKTIEPKEEQEEPKRVLKTIITETWEVFDEDPDSNGIGFSNIPGKTTVGQNPSAAPLKFPPNTHGQKYDFPDLISFL